MTTLTLILLTISSPVSEQRMVYLADFAATVDAESDANRDLLLALAWSESTFNPDSESHAGACGILQLMPKWTEYEGKPVTCQWLKDNVRHSVTLALAELAKWERNCGREWMIAAWNQGYQCCRGGWYYRKRKDVQTFNCSPRAVDFQAKVWRRAKWIGRKLR